PQARCCPRRRPEPTTVGNAAASKSGQRFPPPGVASKQVAVATEGTCAVIRSRLSKAVATLGAGVALAAVLVPASGVWAREITARPRAPACTSAEVKASYRG